MKLFKSLLVAPATLGLLAPLTAYASEVNLNNISNYSEGEVEIDLKSFDNLSSPNQLLAGGEGLGDVVDDTFSDGSFSETTSASFSVDAAIGSVDGDTTSDAVGFDFQFNIGLSTSFTGEDSLDVAIDSGSGTQGPVGSEMGFDSGTGLVVDGVTYSFPLGGASAIVGDATDISAAFTGACAYSGFTDYMGDCGTGNSVGVGGNGVTGAVSYPFESGWSVAAGVSSNNTSVLTTEGSDSIGAELAYTGDNYGVALAFVDADGGTGNGTTFWGINGTFSPESSFVSSISAGIELETVDNSGDGAEGYFLGFTWDEVGPGSVSVGGATKGNFGSGVDELMVYEAAYSYPVNDAITITPGIFMEETGPGVDDKTGFIVKSSFSF